ncbi:MAG: sensor histidine kinase [Planctomycetes bacterium]|nr:sensor histidine kinase [Planctomycetota bacterium]
MDEAIRIYEPSANTEAETPAIEGDFDLTKLSQDASLEAVLAAWHDATVRLQQTHEVLQGEVGRLTDELEAKNRELAIQNRLADLGRMASHVAHEVRNSLVPVTLYMSLLKRRLADDSANMDILAKVEAGFTALNITVNDLLSFTSHREPHWHSFFVRELVEEVCESMGPQLDAQAIRVDTDVAPDIQLSADREMLRRAILNLVLNALDVMTEGGELVITSFSGPKGFELEVADSGPGIDIEQLPRLFEPFYTTKDSGTGLGLAIVHRIAETHGGQVTACNCPEGGAAFTIHIPRRVMGVAA